MEDKDGNHLDRIDKIYGNTEKICAILELIRKDYNKIIYALIAVIAANLGLKFAGTPIIVDIAIYVSIMAGTFVGLMTIFTWHTQTKLNNIARIIFSVFMLFNGICQIVAYSPTIELEPIWYIPAGDTLLIALAVVFLIITWKGREKEKPEDGSLHCPYKIEPRR